MTTRRIGNGAALYRVRVRPPVGRTRTADHDLGIIAPIYRGWRLACTAAEIERLKRAVDQFWSDQYLAPIPRPGGSAFLGRKANEECAEGLDWKMNGPPSPRLGMSG
jgi:hypothetical protein